MPEKIENSSNIFPSISKGDIFVVFNILLYDPMRSAIWTWCELNKCFALVWYSTPLIPKPLWLILLWIIPTHPPPKLGSTNTIVGNADVDPINCGPQYFTIWQALSNEDCNVNLMWTQQVLWISLLFNPVNSKATVLDI